MSTRLKRSREEIEEERAAWEWFFHEVCFHLGLSEEDIENECPFEIKQCRELEFEALCDAAQETAN